VSVQVPVSVSVKKALGSGYAPLDVNLRTGRNFSP
jgi:hypothetical protein